MGGRMPLLGGSFLFTSVATVAVAAGPTLEKDTIPTSGGDLEVTFVGHGSLLFGFGGKVIHVDPFGTLADCGTLPKADLVLISHADGDHLDAAALAAVRPPETRVLVAPACEDRVEGTTLLPNGEKADVDGITVEAVPTCSLVHERPDGSPFHPKGAGNDYVNGPEPRDEGRAQERSRGPLRGLRRGESPLEEDRVPRSQLPPARPCLAGDRFAVPGKPPTDERTPDEAEPPRPIPRPPRRLSDPC